MPSSGALAGRASSAARSSVPSPPSANTISTPSAASGPVDRHHAGQVEVGGLLGDHPHLEPGRDQVARRRSGRAAVLCRRPVCVTSSADRVTVLHRRDRRRAGPARHRPRPGGDHGATRPRRPAARPRRNQRKNSTLPSARAAGWPPPRPRPGPARPPAAATSSTASARSAGSRTTPPAPTRSLPTSNCGFTIGARSPSGAGAGGQRGQHQPQRDERQVGDGQLDRPADQLRASACARWCAPARSTRSSVRSGQASCPYPTSTATTSRGARAQQHVGEPAGGGAGVQAAPARRRPARRPNAASAPASLCPPRETYSVGRILAGDQHRVGRVDHGGGLAAPRCRGPGPGRPRPARRPAPGTGPARGGRARRRDGHGGPSRSKPFLGTWRQRSMLARVSWSTWCAASYSAIWSRRREPRGVGERLQHRVHGRVPGLLPSRPRRCGPRPEHRLAGACGTGGRCRTLRRARPDPPGCGRAAAGLLPPAAARAGRRRAAGRDGTARRARTGRGVCGNVTGHASGSSVRPALSAAGRAFSAAPARHLRRLLGRRRTGAALLGAALPGAALLGAALAAATLPASPWPPLPCRRGLAPGPLSAPPCLPRVAARSRPPPP